MSGASVWPTKVLAAVASVSGARGVHRPTHDPGEPPFTRRCIKPEVVEHRHQRREEDQRRQDVDRDRELLGGEIAEDELGALAR